MMKSWKRILCMVLAGVMLFSTGVVTQAAPVQTAEINSIEGLDLYLSENTNGTITFDVVAALEANYSQDAVNFVQDNINNMNAALSNGNAILNEDFSVTMFFASVRARGVNKVVTHWNGNTDIYMDSDSAQEYIDTLENLINLVSPGATFLSFIVPFIGTAARVSVLDAKLILSMAKTAAEPGTGIIMHIQKNYVTQSDTYYFSPQ